MSRVGFWQLLLDDKVSGWEADAINSAHDKAEAVERRHEALDDRVAALERRLGMMSREIVMLRSAVTVLAQTLKDTDVLDDRLLDARLEAALEEALAPPEPAAGGAPVRMVMCLRCRRQVPAPSTTFTADGPVCDRCP